MTKPNRRNFCGGAFPDWLEVNLTSKCNGICEWCIERNGWHPKKETKWWIIAEKAIDHGALNIILLGGEPTLYKDIKPLIRVLYFYGKRVWITTNGSLLAPKYIENKLKGIVGINISIHHWDLSWNREITGINLQGDVLVESIKMLHNMGVSVRLNCNCIQGYIDCIEDIGAYIHFAKEIGADKIRFAELKQADAIFVDLAKLLNYKYGLNDNPFIKGCNSNTVINGMPVNFRQMCGLQTIWRIEPDNPEGIMKQVLYYDGNLYHGWQTQREETTMTKGKLRKLLADVKNGKVSPLDAEGLIETDIHRLGQKIVKAVTDKTGEKDGGGFCQY